jgi:hypothetical protein
MACPGFILAYKFICLHMPYEPTIVLQSEAYLLFIQIRLPNTFYSIVQ